MSTPTEKQDQFAKHWSSRVSKANEYYNKWENRFQCKKLEDYIEGKQGSGYIINLIYSSIKVKKPSLIFSRPEFTLTPKPWKTDWNPEVAYQISLLKQDTLNSFVQDNSLKFSQEIDMAILDSWSRFGMIEVGYDAKWIKNPNAGKPILKSDYDELKPNEKEGKVLFEAEQIPEKEFVYIKRIPAYRFRIGGFDTHDLSRANWCGYYDWVRIEDLLAAKKYLKNFDDQDISVGRSEDYYFESNQDEKDLESKGDSIKVWKIWDLRKKEFLLLINNPERCIFQEPFTRLPLHGLRFDLRTRGWYPVPVTFNWKSPQDEFNESRNQMRAHRKRARQMWQAMEQTVDSEEIEKFISGPDGTLIMTKRDDAIKPIQNSAVDSAIIQSLQLGDSEYDKISGTSNNQRGLSDRTTATESNTIETRTRVREETDQAIVAEWLCDIARDILQTVIEKFSEAFQIKRNADVGEIGDEFNILQQNYQLIHASMLEDGADFDVNCTVSAMSPVTQELDKKKFLEFLAVLKEYDILALHPNVIRKAAFLCGFRDEVVIKALMQAAQLAMVAKVSEGQNNMQNQGGNLAQNTVAQATPPDMEQIRQQLQ